MISAPNYSYYYHYYNPMPAKRLRLRLWVGYGLPAFLIFMGLCLQAWS